MLSLFNFRLIQTVMIQTVGTHPKKSATFHKTVMSPVAKSKTDYVGFGTSYTIESYWLEAPIHDSMLVSTCPILLVPHGHWLATS